MKKITLPFFLVLAVAILASQGTLMFKGTDQYNLFFGQKLG